MHNNKSTKQRRRTRLRIIYSGIAMIAILIMLFFSCYNIRITQVVAEKNNSKAGTMVPNTATEVVKAMKVGWNLGNSLECSTDPDTDKSGVKTYQFYEKYGNNPLVTREMINAVKDKGFKSIRIPVSWARKLPKTEINYSENSEDEIYKYVGEVNGKIDEGWMNRVKEVVDYVLKDENGNFNDDDVYCIINVHHDVGKGSWPIIFATDNEDRQEMYKNRLVNLWKQISEEFKDYDNRLIFEGFNEILVEDNGNNWITSEQLFNSETYKTKYNAEKVLESVNVYNQAFVDTVRATGGNNTNRFLCVNTYGAELKKEAIDYFVLPKNNGIVDNRLIVQIHQYDESDNDQIYTTLKNKFLNNNVPVIIGEYGYTLRNSSDSKFATRVKYHTNILKQLGITCFWWDMGYSNNKNAQGFSFLDRENLNWRFTNSLQSFLDGANLKTEGNDTELDYILNQGKIDTGLEVNKNSVFEIKGEFFMPDGQYVRRNNNRNRCERR